MAPASAKAAPRKVGRPAKTNTATIVESIVAYVQKHPGTSGEAARNLADDVAAQFGRIDVLVHAVGGFAGGKSVADTDDTTLDKMLDLNYRSAFFVARAVLPHMRQQGGGRFLAVASRQAVDPGAMVGAYSASKAALVALVRTIALENADRCISVNTVLPGTMDTPANRAAADPKADPLQWVQPTQVAALLLHLASDAGAQVTGAAIPIRVERLLHASRNSKRTALATGFIAGAVISAPLALMFLT